VRRVAQTLGVSRSHLHERLRHGSKLRSNYRKSEDAELLEPVRRLVDERPTYGYRRIGALLNRERLQAGLPRLNHKRIYRLMAQNGLVLQRYTSKPPGRLHEGRIITIRPNLRWTSDSFEVACWNGEVLRVAFALDTCDREVTAWCASSSGISRQMVRDLIFPLENKSKGRGVPNQSTWGRNAPGMRWRVSPPPFNQRLVLSAASLISS
jgi:transposase InsO family protein